ncbi:MAG: DUF4382 domain-containing protein [Pseudomonadales bacterium]|nr:DUF4382 domain-containing protein [Pseudomonadales bacterium]
MKLFKPGFIKKRSKQTLPYLYTLIAAFMAVTLTACDTSSSTGASDGNLTVSLTDAPGDFSVYAVDVTAISLTNKNGTVIETLPLSTTVDFSQYVDMTEFLTAGTVPSGAYTHGSMTLDFSAATIEAEDLNGNPISITQFVDTDGQAITTLEVNIQLDGKHALVIAPGVASHLSLDFDLKASNSVDFSDPNNPVLTIDPVLIAEVNFERDKPHRIRGAIKNVDVDQSSYTVILRPFLHKQSNDNRFGELTVITDSQTVFDIDDVSYTGEGGLNAMADLPELSATRAIGHLKFNPRRFVATQVLAGSSVEGGQQDVVRGTVTARTGDTLTIQGATLIRADGSFVFKTTIDVLVADSTLVKKQFSVETHSILDVSVGQRVAIFGLIVDPTAEQLELDASNGALRMLMTALRGHVAQNGNLSASELAIELQSINRRPAAVFDFSGTGKDASNDAMPSFYQVGNSTLNLSEFKPGSPLLAKGFVTPFGSAPIDFEAHTLVSFDALAANLVVIWNPAVLDAFATLSPTGFTLNLTDSGQFHHLSQGGGLIDLAELESAVQITPTEADSAAYAITQPNSPRVVHTTFAELVTDLQARLDAGAATRKVHVHGNYDAAAQQLISGRIWIQLR